MNGLVNSFIAAIEPMADLTMTQYVDTKRILPEKSSIEPGPYDSKRTPYLIEIMDCLSITSMVTDITFQKGTQLGATEVGNNFFCYVVDIAPGPMLFYLPTKELGSDHVKACIDPTIEAMPSLKKKIINQGGRKNSNTIFRKDFPGGILFVSGANSPASTRNKSIRYLVIDDLDGIKTNVATAAEGDTIDRAEKRTDTYSFRKKIYRNSTPTIKGLSRINKAFLEGDQSYYHVACPFCGYRQRLVWGGPDKRKGIKFKRNKLGEVAAVWYECAKCHEPIDESYKPEMMEYRPDETDKGGAWVPTYKRRKKRSFHLSSLYSPLGWVSWKQIVEEFLAAKDNPERLRVWVNLRMADVWDEKGSQPKWRVLKDRAELYKMRQIPDAVVFLTAGVDVQENRLVAVVRGWADEEQSYLVYWTELFGNPGQSAVWDQLDMLLSLPFNHPIGRQIYIKRCAVDSGYLPNEVYSFCRARPEQTMVTKGASTMNLPIVNKPSWVDVDIDGETLKDQDGVQLWRIGTDSAKAQIYNRLSMEVPGKGYYHFPSGVDSEYYKQLTAEKKVTQFRNGFPMPVWVKLRNRNDVLDCEVLALAAALREGMAFINWERARMVQLGQVPRAVYPESGSKTSASERAEKW